MQHVRDNKELSIFYSAKKLYEMDFLFEGSTWSNMTSGEEYYHIIKIFEHEKEVSTGQAIGFKNTGSGTNKLVIVLPIRARDYREEHHRMKRK